MQPEHDKVLTFREQLTQLGGLWARAKRRAILAGVLFSLGSVIAVAVAILKPRKYMSETQILYREGIKSTDVTAGEAFGDPTRKLAMRLQEMVRSRSRLKKIIDEFKLYPDIVDKRGYVDAEDELRKATTFRVKDGDNFYLTFTDTDPDRVQRVTARLADALIEENTRTKSQQAELTREFLDTEKRRAEDELRQHESNLAKFLSKHPEFARDAQNAASRFTPTKPSKTSDPTLQALEREAQRLQERLGLSVPKQRNEAAADPKLLAAKTEAESELNAAQRELNASLARYTEQHPDVVSAKAKLKGAEARYKRALDALAAGENNRASKEQDAGVIDRATLESQLSKINEEIAAYKQRKKRQGAAEEAPIVGGAASAVVALETEWSRINRELAEARERFQKIQEKQFRATMLESVVQSGRAAQMIIVDPAYRPTHPAPPGRSVVAMIGIVAALLVAALVTFLLAILDDRMYYPGELQRLDLGPVLGSVPHTRREKRMNRG